ncbi:MAG: 4-alpha-glucanotransferase, partial [Planctomycetota bacterium]
GFEAYWAIPYGSKTAVEGKWVKGPGSHLFKAFQAKWPHMPFIAEDLGVITPKVEELRDRFHLPGMKVLQFAFLNDSSNSFLPHYHIPHSVVYTGTHDNDTCQGWYQQAGEREKEYFLEYSYSDGTEVHWDMIRLAISSVSRMAIYPLQDVLGLDSSARMNTPSVEKGNWTWRAPEKGIPKESLARLAHWVELFGR